MQCPMCNGTGEVDSTGVQVRSWRLDAGLTQAELAQKSGLSRNGIAAIERGGNVTINSLKAIAIALGLEVEMNMKKIGDAPVAAGGGGESSGEVGECV